MTKITLQHQPTEFFLYTVPNGAAKVEVLLGNETIWLTQKRMAELFGVSVPAVPKHLKTYLNAMNYKKKWYVPFWNTPPRTVTSAAKRNPNQPQSRRPF